MLFTLHPHVQFPRSLRSSHDLRSVFPIRGLSVQPLTACVARKGRLTVSTLAIAASSNRGNFTHVNHATLKVDKADMEIQYPCLE